MVGFLLGERLNVDVLRRTGQPVFAVSAFVAVATLLVMAVVTWAVGALLTTALVLAGIALATDSLATTDVIGESGAEGPAAEFTRP